MKVCRVLITVTCEGWTWAPATQKMKKWEQMMKMWGQRMSRLSSREEADTSLWDLFLLDCFPDGNGLKNGWTGMEAAD